MSTGRPRYDFVKNYPSDKNRIDELERELVSEQEKVKRLRKTLEKCNAEFIAMKNLGDKDMELAIADTRATLEATK